MPSTSRNQDVAAPWFFEYCHLVCTTCRKCVQLASHVYLWHTVPTNYRLQEPGTGKHGCYPMFWEGGFWPPFLNIVSAHLQHADNVYN